MKAKTRPFRFSPESLLKLEIETLDGTTKHPIDYEPFPNLENPTAGEMIIELARQRCRPSPPYDGTLMGEIRKMTIQDVLIAAHGYLDGELKK